MGDIALMSSIADMSFPEDIAIMSVMKDITLRSPEQLGITIRLKRKEKGLSQSALAELLGVERKWVLRLEAGNPTAELGLVLKALKTLGLQASLSEQRGSGPATKLPFPDNRLDEVFRRLRQRERK
jgi:HTH-type transcriptional regulator/antitoxin HipB